MFRRCSLQTEDVTWNLQETCCRTMPIMRGESIQSRYAGKMIFNSTSTKSAWKFMLRVDSLPFHRCRKYNALLIGSKRSYLITWQDIHHDGYNRMRRVRPEDRSRHRASCRNSIRNGDMYRAAIQADIFEGEKSRLNRFSNRLPFRNQFTLSL